MRRKGISLWLALCLLAVGGRAQADVHPGQTPPPKQMAIEMNAELIFPSALSLGRAGIVNPEGNPWPLRYTLSLAPEELERAAGIRLGGGEAIPLYESPAVAPGEGIECFRLNPLPDGRLLPEGRYEALMSLRPAMEEGSETGSEFAVEVSLWVMASQMEARADDAGRLNIVAYNGTSSPARFGLLISAQELGGDFGVDVSALGPENSYALLALSRLLAPGQGEELRLGLLPDGSRIAPGRYESWLIRLPEGEEACAVARVTLEMETVSRGPEPLAAIPLPMLTLAQAVVNARYLLSRP